MSRRLKTALAVAVATLCTGSLLAGDRDDDRGRPKSRFFVHATLEGYQEVPAISTTGTGRFRAWVDTEANTINWKLSYDALEGEVTQSHVHFGQMTANGGVSFFLCTNLANGPAGTQALPGGTGRADRSDHRGPGDRAGWYRVSKPAPSPRSWRQSGMALRTPTSTSAKWPAGEIRGQLH